VLGSFLHNLRVPLRGHLMTAISAALLAAAHRRRPEPGALWRAGLVCAALKSVSPSAVLLGPMVAITAEGFLMAAGVALLPGAAGRALGGGLAMAWIPAHLAGRALLLYGLDAARLFEAAWGKASAPLGLTLGPWSLLGLLWLAHFLAGALLGPQGPEAGLRMALRALVLSAGFAALSQELAGPRVRARLAAWGAAPLLTAVEGAFASLPNVLARLPDPAQSLRRPGAALAALLDAAEPPAVFLVAGGSGEGKTRFLADLRAELVRRGVPAGGFLAPGRWEGGRRAGFDLEDAATGARRELSRRDGPPQWERLAGPFHFSPEALVAGRALLAAAPEGGVLLVDEVGPLELAGGGWSAELDRLAQGRQAPMVWAVRRPLLETVQARWGVYAAKVWTPADDPAAAADLLATATRR
jgi:nucleoside-triphosphatase THEP1